MAFRTCTSMATKECVRAAGPVILEPVMRVDVSAPLEFQGTLLANLTRRKGVIVATETRDDYAHVSAEVGLSKMFGYSTDLRSQTEGKGEFSMEYVRHAPIARDEQEALIKEREREEAAKKK